MKECYVVISSNIEKIEASKVEAAFPDHLTLNELAWVIATDLKTCSDVCAEVGLKPPPREGTLQDFSTGLVVKLEEYNGFFARELWEKIDVWKAET